jgi:hypothetical protein
LAGWPLNEFVPNTLVVPFGVIVFHEVANQLPEMPFAQRHDAIEALRLD